MLGEDIENELGAVEHLAFGYVGKIMELGRGQFPVEDEDSRAVLQGQHFELGHLALAHDEFGVDLGDALHHASGDVESRRPGEFGDATVTLCHSRTANLADECRSADFLFLAVGRPRMVTGDMVKKGAVVIDVGINRTDDGLCGDADYDSVFPQASAITPVPGGVGPMTIAMLLKNTVDAWKART